MRWQRSSCNTIWATDQDIEKRPPSAIACSLLWPLPLSADMIDRDWRAYPRRGLVDLSWLCFSEYLVNCWDGGEGDNKLKHLANRVWLRGPVDPCSWLLGWNGQTKGWWALNIWIWLCKCRLGGGGAGGGVESWLRSSSKEGFAIASGRTGTDGVSGLSRCYWGKKGRRFQGRTEYFYSTEQSASDRDYGLPSSEMVPKTSKWDSRASKKMRFTDQ